MPWVPWERTPSAIAKVRRGGLLLGDVEQLVVRDNDHGVDAVGERLNALFGALLALCGP